MSSLTFENLEYFDARNKSWTKAKFLGVAGDNKYLIGIDTELPQQDIIEVNEENLRLINLVKSLEDNSNPDAIYEYCYKKDSFVPCEILNKKGKFYSIKANSLSVHSSVSSENSSMQIIKIAREKEIRKITSTHFSQILNTDVNQEDSCESYGNIHIEIPDELTNWIESDSIVELIGDLSEDFSLCYYSTYHKHSHNYLRIFSINTHLTTIQLMIEVAIQNELKLLKFESDKNSTLQKLQNVKKELDKIKKFYINKEFVGLLIGSKGANVNRLKQKYDVTIVIQSDIPGDDALVTITGENEKSVEECVKESKFVKKSFEIKTNTEGRLKPIIQELAQKFNFLKMFITREKLKDETRGNYYLSYLNIFGTENSVEEVIRLKDLNAYLIIQ